MADRSIENGHTAELILNEITRTLFIGKHTLLVEGASDIFLF